MKNSHSNTPSSFTFNYRKRLISSFSEFINELQSYGMNSYYFNFMFNKIAGNEASRKERMWSDVQRVHHLLTRQIVRNRKSDAWRHLWPIFILCPDFPVPKNKKANVKAHNANDGLHIGGVVLAPPPCPSYVPKGIRQHSSLGKLSRMKVHLDQHFEEKMPQYLTDKLYRIDISPVRYGTMADYTLKAFKSGKVQYDDIRVF